MIRALVRQDGYFVTYSDEIHRANPHLFVVEAESWDEIKLRAEQIAHAKGSIEVMIAQEAEEKAAEQRKIDEEKDAALKKVMRAESVKYAENFNKIISNDPPPSEPSSAVS